MRASPPMEPTVQPNGHVCTTCGAVTGSPNAEPKPSKSRLKLGLASTSLAVGLFCGAPVFPQTHYRESPDCQIVSQLSASHGSRFPLAFVVRTGNQGLGKRLGASPNRPVWSGAAVQAQKEGRSREATTRCIKGLENVNRSIYGPSQPRHTLVLERIPDTSAPTVQTTKVCHVWLFGRLEPLVEMLC